MIGRSHRCWSISRCRNNWSRGIGRCWGISWGRGRVSRLVVLEEGLVRAGDSLILDISMILLVLINKVIHNLHSAVRQLHSVLTYKTISSINAIQRLLHKHVMRHERSRA